MEDWKVRLLVEQKELKEKFVKLVEFISRATDASQMYDSIDHEKKHIVEHISNYYGVDPKSEESAYLSGELGRLIWPAAAWVLCPRCRESR